MPFHFVSGLGAPHIGTRVKFKDIFDGKELYEQFKDYLIDKGWTSEIGHLPPFGREQFESRYYEKIDPRGAKEIWFHWRISKGGESQYIKHFLDIDTHCVNLVNHEIMVEGKKRKVMKGEIEFNLRAWLKTDPGDKWATHWFLKYIKKLWENRLYGGEVAVSRDRLRKEIYEAQDFLKKFFQMRRWLTGHDREWKPTAAYPSHVKKGE